MEKFPTLLISLLPVFGVIVGASLQYFFSRFAEKRKQLEVVRNQAYADYLRSVAQIAQVDKRDPKRRAELLAMAADAKTRICVYGSATVIEALASFEKSGPSLDSSDSMTRFLAICNEMRRQGLGKPEIVEAENLNLVLFGRDASA